MERAKKSVLLKAVAQSTQTYAAMESVWPGAFQGGSDGTEASRWTQAEEPLVRRDVVLGGSADRCLARGLDRAVPRLSNPAGRRTVRIVERGL